MEQEQDTQDIEARLMRLRSHAESKEKSRKKIMYAILLCISLCGLGTLLGLNVYAGDKTVKAPLPTLPHNPFDSVSLEGAYAVVWDIDHQAILYTKDATTTHPLASVTKLMTAYTAHSHAPDILSVPIHMEDLSLEGDQGLILGEEWRLSDLLDFSLVTSSNDGMSAIAAAIGSRDNTSIDTHEVNKEYFVRMMNDAAHNLNLDSMKFYNESGLDDEPAGIAGGYGSALDVAKLLGILLRTYPETLDRTRDRTITIDSLSGFTHTGENTNLSAAKIPGLLASKTGFTNLAGGNLAVVFDAGLGRPIAVVVLGSSIEGRFQDVESLVARTEQYIKEYEPILKEIEAREALEIK